MIWDGAFDAVADGDDGVEDVTLGAVVLASAANHFVAANKIVCGD